MPPAPLYRGKAALPGTHMPIYRCYFFNQSGSIVDWKPIDCDTDAEADQLSAALLVGLPQHHAIEVWHMARCAFRHHARRVVH
jgi:hypothetical protein